MYTRRDKREKTHPPTRTHHGLLFFSFCIEGEEADSVKRCQVATGRRAAVIDASSPALCVCAPPVCVERSIVSPPVLCFWLFILEPCCPPPEALSLLSPPSRLFVCVAGAVSSKIQPYCSVHAACFSFFCPICARKASGILFIRVCCVRSWPGASVDVGGRKCA